MQFKQNLYFSPVGVGGILENAIVHNGCKFPIIDYVYMFHI